LTWPERSIFGARLRSRWPQYGHSVMYGDTSELQFLQMTKRSGSVDTLARLSHSAVAATISAMTSRRSWLAS
jgi:hypothetical protein